MDAPNATDPANRDNGDASTVEHFVAIDPDDYASVVEMAGSEGVGVERLEGRNLVDPASISVILIGSSLAVATVASLIDQRRGGQVFDMRPDASRPAYRSKEITYGYVLVIATDGSVSVEVKEPKGMFGQVLDTIASIVKDSMGSSAAATKGRIEDALGDSISAQTNP